MSTTRLNLSALLVMVAVLAVVLAIARSFEGNEHLLTFGPMALALQFAAFRLIRRRSPFWLGFLAFGVLAVGSLALTVLWYPQPVPMQARSLGQQVVMAPWVAYRALVHDAMRHVGLTYAVLPVGIILTIPQLLAASAGGLVTWLIADIARRPGVTRSGESSSPG